MVVFEYRCNWREGYIIVARFTRFLGTRDTL
jgi:hypothetical protein